MRALRRLHRLAPAFVLAALAALVAACGPASTKTPPPPLPPFHYGPDVDAREYFPLAEGNTWTHAITRPGIGHPEELLGLTRVTGVHDGKAFIDSPGGVFSYALLDDGIMKDTARTYVLKEPIVSGARWSTGSMITPAGVGDSDNFASIERVDATVSVRAGAFSDCIVVKEVAEGQELVTTYCPRVGPALIELRVHDPASPEPVLAIRYELVAFVAGGAGPALGESKTTIEKTER